MCKISVIIPVYNTEKYIEKCINSVINQSIYNKDIEIIVVNDGSTDNSEQVIKNVTEKNNNINIKYLKKENGGLSDARNYGLEHATGEYIEFIDSDDYIENDLYKNLSEYIDNGYDIIKFKISIVDEEGKKLFENYTPTFKEKTGEEAFDILYKSDKMMDTAWSYVYKRNLWVENNFKYAKGMYHEDFGLTSLVLLKANKVASINALGYNYVQTKNSITRGNKEKISIMANDLLIHYDNMLNKIKEYNISKRTIENIKEYYTNCIILEVNNLDGKEKDNYIKKIKERKMIKNIKIRNLKQLIKKILLIIDIKLYLKVRKY